MGGVQAKPERKRHVLERNTSFANKNHKVVPISSEPTDAFCKHFQEVMRSYPADCKDEKDLQAFDAVDAELGTGVQEVLRSTGLDQFKQGLKYLTDSPEKIMRVILSCKKKILEAEDVSVMKVNENLLDHVLILEFFNNSSQTLQLCKGELQDFIDSAREIHACISDVVLERKVSKKLQELEKKYRRSSEAVVAKLKTVGDQHVDMLNKLKERIQKLDKKVKLTRTLKKVVKVVFKGLLYGLLVCNIMAAAMASPPVASVLCSHVCVAGVIAGGAVAYAFSSVLKEGQHRLLTLIEGYESTLPANKDVLKSMEAGAGDAIKELDAIMFHVKKVIAKENDLKKVIAKENDPVSDLSSESDEGRVGVESDQEVIVMEKLADFDKEIEELHKRKEQCVQVIEKARDQVQNEYRELKSSEVWSTKKKMQ